MRYVVDCSTDGEWFVIDARTEMLVTPPMIERLAKCIAEKPNRSVREEARRAVSSL